MFETKYDKLTIIYMHYDAMELYIVLNKQATQKPLI